MEIENKEMTNEKKDKQKLIAGFITAFVVILVIFLLILFKNNFGFGAGKNDAKRLENAYKLVKKYSDKGEYERALSILDGILLENADDETALELFNKIIELKKDNEGKGGVSEIINTTNSNLKVDFDTDGITNAMQNSISTMKDALEQSNKQAEESRKAMENLMKLQEEQKKAEEQRRIQAAEAEEERKAQEAAAAERKRQLEEKRKAEEAEVAKKNEKIKKKINDLNSELEKGKAALAVGDIESAEKYFQNVSDMMPTEMGVEYDAAKKSEMAEALFNAAEKASDKVEKDKLMKNAVQMAERTLKENSKDSISHYILAQNSINDKKYEDALKELNLAVQNDPNNYLYYYDMGRVLYNLKRYSEAAVSFDSSSKRNPDHANARYNLGLCYLKLKNENAAVESFRKAIDLNPRYEKAYLELARLLGKRNDYSGAIAAYENVISINNMNSVAVMELGSVYYNAKKYGKAEECYRKAITMLGEGEQMVMTKYNLSTVLYDANKTAEAEKYAKEAYESCSYIKNDKSKANIIYNYAMILGGKDDVDNAIPLYMEVLKYNPDHLKTKVNLGVMYVSIDPPEVDTALALFLQVYNVDSKNFEVNNNLGSAYLLKEDYKNAILYFQNALKIDSKNNTVRANLAKAYVKNLEFDNAKTVYTEVLKTDNKHWESYIELAKVCMQLNDNESAEKYLVYLQAKNPSYKPDEVEMLLGSFN